MRLKAVLLVAALGAIALPASAQGGYRDCRDARGDNQAAGLILGGILGGVLGSNVAASGHRHDGTAVGAVVGGLVGSGIGRGSTNCGPTSGPGYRPGDDRGGDYNRGYGSYSGYAPPPPPGTYAPGYAYDRGQPYYEYGNRDIGPQGRDLYQRDNRSYEYNDDYAGRDCSQAIQITRLPDGTEIRRSVDACRDAYYGDWQVRN